MISSLQARIKNIEREIKALKCSQKLPSLLRGYSYTLPVDVRNISAQYTIYTFRVTYESGQNDIISEFIFPGPVTPLVPSGNTQIIRISVGYEGVQTLQVLSTRPIVSVVRI